MFPAAPPVSQLLLQGDQMRDMTFVPEGCSWQPLLFEAAATPLPRSFLIFPYNVIRLVRVPDSRPLPRLGMWRFSDRATACTRHINVPRYLGYLNMAVPDLQSLASLFSIATSPLALATLGWTTTLPVTFWIPRVGCQIAMSRLFEGSPSNAAVTASHGLRRPHLDPVSSDATSVAA